MARGFRRKKGRFVADLDAVEREVVLDVLRRTAELLEGEAGPASSPASTASAESDDPFEVMMRRAGFGQEPEPDGPGPAPSQDPALRRLLPDGHHDDPEASAAFARMAADGVRLTKLEHLRRAADALDGQADSGRPERVDLAEDQAVALLRALTDVRLVLAERLGLHSDDDVEHLEAQLAALRAGDERAQAMLAYDFLTWLQETLAAALMPG